jgi:hypothetical protein
MKPFNFSPFVARSHRVCHICGQRKKETAMNPVSPVPGLTFFECRKHTAKSKNATP